MTSAQALAAYETARHRMPPGQTASEPPQRVSSLLDIADAFDVFFLDAFGVLNIGEDPIAGVPETVAALQAAGKRVLVVSNAAGLPHERLMEKYAHLGYDFAPDDVVTSRKAMAAAVAARSLGTAGLMVGDDVDAGEFARGKLLVKHSVY
jgi:ribonucleotide monophosphatase NagD (HAD superfamily)